MSLKRVQAIPPKQLQSATGIPNAPPPTNGPLGSGSIDQPIFRLNLFRALQLHRRMVLGFTLGGLLLAVAYIVKAWPVYTAQSQIYVQPVQMKVMAAGPDSSLTSNSAAYDSFVQQQVQSASNPDLLIAALHKLKPGSWQRKGESEQAAAERLGGAILVARIGTSYEVAIAAKAKDPQLVAQIANAVATSIVERASGEGNAGNVQRIAVLSDERIRIQNQLNSDYAEQEELNKQLGMAAVGTEAPDLIDADIGRTREELIKAQTDHDQAESRFVAMGAGKGDSSAATDAEADDMVAADAGLTSMKTSLNSRRATLITQMSNLTPNNPEYKLDAAELAKINGNLDSMMKDLRAKAAARIQQKMRTDLERTAGVESRLNGQLRKLAATAASATPKLQRASDLATDIARLRLRYTSVDEQVHNLMLEDSAPGAVHLSAAAVPPLHPTISGILKKALPCALGGLIFGLLAASLATHLDPKVYIAADVEQVMGFAPMAVLPDFDEVSNEVSAEHLLRLSSAIEHARKQGNLNNCIFTGTSSGVGVTTLVTRAGEILKAMGRPTVLLDSSGTPPPAPRAGSALDQPATERGSRSTALLRQVTAETELEQENLVLTDTAPLLISAETEYLARFVDCAIVVVESGVTTRAQLLAAANTLQRLEVASVGFVLNRVKLAKADPAFRHSVHDIEKHQRAQRLSTARRTERNSPLADQPSANAKELPSESAVTAKSEAQSAKPAAKPPAHRSSPEVPKWSTAAPVKPWLPQSPKPAETSPGVDMPWWLSDAHSQTHIARSKKPKEPLQPDAPREPLPSAQSKTDMRAHLIPVQSWESASAWANDLIASAAKGSVTRNVAEIAPAVVEDIAPRVAEKAIPLEFKRVAPIVLPEVEPLVAVVEPTKVERDVLRVFAEPKQIVEVEEETKAIEQTVPASISAPVMIEEVEPIEAVPTVVAPMEATQIAEVSVVVAKTEPAISEEAAEEVAPADARPAEAEALGVQAASRLNPLRGLMFSLGLKNLNRVKHGAPLDKETPAPVLLRSDREVITRALPQFAEPVPVTVPGVESPQVEAPLAEALPVEAEVVSAPVREVTVEPEVLAPKEFIPVRETEEAPATSPSRSVRLENFDEVRILPSRRGQYKR